MTIFVLKCIAVLSMLLDHVGAIYLPEMQWLRIIGRLAFPIFAWLIGMGAIHSKDTLAYARRLGLFAIISEIPFFLAFYDGSVSPVAMTHNIFFTLFLGLISILFVRAKHLGSIRYLCALLLAIIAGLLRTDYGMYGVLLMLLLYLCQQIPRLPTRLLCQVLGMSILLYLHLSGINEQFFALVALLPIALYNGKQGPRYTRFFYWFYPIHLLLLGIGRFVL